MITQSAKLNLIPGAVLPRINVSQYDKGSRTLEFPIYDGEQRFTLTSSMSASIHGTKPDGNGFAYAGTVNTTDNIVEIDVVQQMTAVSGEVVCEVIITKSGKRIGTVNFILNVQPAALNDNTVISDSDLSIVEEALEFAEDIPGYRTEFEGYVEDAEAWAKGTRNGSAVPSTDPTYHNNSKYYANRYTELTAAITTMTNDLGAKNVLPFYLEKVRAANTNGTWSGNSYTHNQVTFTINDDLSISVSGTATDGNALFRFTEKTMAWSVANGNYVLNGLPSEGSSSTFRARYTTFQNGTSSGWTYQTTTSGSDITLTDVDGIRVDFVVYQNYQVPSGFVWKPMLRPASITDATYATPSKTNQALTADVVSLQDNEEVNGAVNMLQNTASTSVSNGITCTVDSDGIMTLTSDGTTRTGNTDFIVNPTFALVDGMTYKLSGCPSGGAADNSGYRLLIYTYGAEIGEGLTFTANSTDGLSKIVVVRVGKDYVFNGSLVFKPMITVPTYNGDYVPYAKSNKELTDDVATVTDSAAQGVSAYGGTLAISPTGVTANVATQIISKRGVYLVLFTIYDVASAAYLINVDSSDSSKCFASELAAPPSGVTITFDFSTAGKVKVTADHGYRARVITIADANY